MKVCSISVLLAVLLISCSNEPTVDTPAVEKATIKAGTWRMEVQSPGGPLPFALEISQQGEQWQAVAINGEERLKLDHLLLENDQVRFGIEHYESMFTGKPNSEGTRIEGEWTKVVGTDKISKLPFVAEHGRSERFVVGDQDPVDVSGTWAVTFANGDDEPEQAVGRFEQNGKQLTGTFMTPTGDYRFLAGNVDGNRMMLSCYDGGHMFLFSAELVDGQLSGDFWSRDTYHDTWTAVRDENAKLPDAYEMTALNGDGKTFRFSFPDLDGKVVNQDDARFEGKVRLITLFGSWCPNCNDEAPVLQELYDTYSDRGLEVLGLAFEMTGDTERDVRVLRRFQKRHKLSYPILLAGGSIDKAKAAEALPDLDKLLSYPTTLLINREGEVVSIHTGFTGPGTGQAFESLKDAYREKIEALL